MWYARLCLAESRQTEGREVANLGEEFGHLHKWPERSLPRLRDQVSSSRNLVSDLSVLRSSLKRSAVDAAWSETVVYLHEI